MVILYCYRCSYTRNHFIYWCLIPFLFDRRYPTFPYAWSTNQGISLWVINVQNDPEVSRCVESQMGKLPDCSFILWCSEHYRMSLGDFDIPASGRTVQLHSDMVWSLLSGPHYVNLIQQYAKILLIICADCGHWILIVSEAVGRLHGYSFPKVSHTQWM